MKLQVLTMALFAGLAAGCDDNENSNDVGYDSSLVGDVEQGRTEYDTQCAACHGLDGDGTSAGPSILDELDDTYEMWEVIRLGDDDMPPIDMTDQAIADVVAYMQEEL